MAHITVSQVFILQVKRKWSVATLLYFLRDKWGLFYFQLLSLMVEFCNTYNGSFRQCKPAIYPFSCEILSSRWEKLVLLWETLFFIKCF